MISRRNAFTLVELMVATTLLAVAVGVTTLGMPGATTEQQLQTAATKIASAIRLATAEAKRSSRPHVLVLEGNTCRIERPIFRDNHWRWDGSVRFALPEKVSVSAVRRTLAGSAPVRSREQVRIPVSPESTHSQIHLTLTADSGVKVGVQFSNSGRTVEFQPIED